MPPLMMSPELPPSPAASDQLDGASKVEKAPRARKVAASQASIAMNGRSGLSWLNRFTAGHGNANQWQNAEAQELHELIGNDRTGVTQVILASWSVA